MTERVRGHRLRTFRALAANRALPVVEIALLHSVPRTATVIAHSDATVYQLNREPFLSAVLGHAQTFREASRIAGARLAADVERDHPQQARLPLPSSPAGRGARR